MFNTRNLFRIAGLLSGAGLLVCAYVAAQPRSASEENAPLAQVSAYYFHSPERIRATDVSRRLRVGDPVFLHVSEDKWRQIGHVESLDESKELTATILWYGEHSPVDFKLVSYQNSGRLDDVIATMLPPEKREQIQQRLAKVMRAHGEELSRAFTPLVEESLRRSMPIVEEEFRLAVDRHRADVDRLAARWNDEVVRERLIPLAQEEIVPIVREHGEPTAERIGRELWDRASLWRFGWRIAYDRSPLPERNLVQEEWERFVEQEAVPVFEDYMDEIVVSVQRILSDVAANRAVRRELAEVASDLAADPEARELVRQILKESLIDNERLKRVWREVWTSDDAEAALEMASDRLEPVVRGIGDDLFGTEEEGIDPNFARVLRNQILRKDRRWIVAEWSSIAKPWGIHRAIQPASEFEPFPVVYMADDDIANDVTGESSQ